MLQQDRSIERKRRSCRDKERPLQVQQGCSKTVSGIHRIEEFKGTGNSELILDRKVSDKRTFPAIDISRSGTRKEELITDPQLLKKMYVLRRILNPMGTMDAIDFLLDKLRNTKNNAEFFESMNT